MSDLTEILKYSLPTLIVLVFIYLLVRQFLTNEIKRRKAELSMSRQDATLPLRLQAYERLILLLERISPESIVMRVNSASLSSAQLQNEMISSIRQEFEHNLAQQCYISIPAWEKVKMARTEMIKLVNMSAAEIRPADPGIHLSKRILEKAMELQKSPTSEAINSLKAEIQELF